MGASVAITGPIDCKSLLDTGGPYGTCYDVGPPAWVLHWFLNSVKDVYAIKYKKVKDCDGRCLKLNAKWCLTSVLVKSLYMNINE